ncbi:iron complex outermembrane receptor protein [Blastomonas natatoria]|uniref:Iron complex outermembrane receptor protein n=1 Tax=Blastomonas natatoria TaxID=34015 RepID=A0A2V3VPW9_9SPHN|nr:TonB-dependent receptor [Blastomonas natatoria]PXW78599.1 iron complex outermembrane receptor protein [Blastomonas natatoria]
MRHIMILSAVLMASAAAPALAHTAGSGAREPGQEETDTVGKDADIVVTAARTILPPNALPLTIDIINKQALDQQIILSGSVTDAVATLTPSFSPTRGKLSGAGETLRGRSPLYAINGIPQSTPLRDGSRDGFTIDGFFVEHVELIYGSNALQGIGGTGGIVNQVTVGAPKQEGLSGRVLLQGTADNDFRSDGFGAKVAGLVQYKADRFDATVGASYERRGVFYDAHGRAVGINLTQGETQTSNTLSLFGRFGYALSSTARIDLMASRYELKGDGEYVAVAGNRLTGRPTSAVRGTPPGEPAANRTESVALTITDTDLAGGNFVSQIFFNRTRDTFGGELGPIATFQDERIAPVGALFDQSQNRSRKLGGKVSYERAMPGFEDLTAIVGFDALFDKTEQRLIATDRIWVPPTDFRSLAPFAQANLKLFDGVVRLAGGARWESVEIKIDDYTTIATTTTPRGGVLVSGGSPKFDDVLFNGGVIIEPAQGIRLYASYAEGFTVPDVGRITRAIGTRGVDLDNFLDISPIVSNNREIGAEVKRGPIDASVTYFWSSSTRGQLLVARPDGIFDVQRQRIEIEGLELNLGVQLPIDGLRVSAGYAHILGRTDTNGDDRVDTDLDGTNISPDRLNLAASFDRGKLSARVQTQIYFSRTFNGLVRDPRNDFGGYTLTDAYIGYDVGPGRVILSAQNIFNRQYIDYNSDVRLPTDNLSFFAGRGRTMTLAWDMRF